MATTITTTQQPKSYTIDFVVTSDDYPGLPVVIKIYKNDDLYYTLTGTEGVSRSYTFNELTSGNVEYTIDGYANAGAPDPLDYEYISPVPTLTVKEYKPTFTLPTISCVQLNETHNFFPTGWNQNENGLCPATPETQKIEYKRYEFNMDTSTYVDVDDDYSANILTTPGDVANPATYAYTWTPTKLAMVKIVTKITNCSTSVEKATVFPVCGSWKIRRLACGDYRLYNYKSTNINYTLSKGVGINAIPILSGIVGAFNYIFLQQQQQGKILEDGIYTIQVGSEVQYIINYCDIEACMLDLHKRVLLDDSLCDDCKMDKVLYQKALRLLPTYETWKKLLDKDWIYDMQYKSTDAAGELAKLYDAQELYLELKNLCVDCGTSSTKKCNCN
jgi:hypothetical protein